MWKAAVVTTTAAPDGTSITWTEEGEGPNVVLVHGITESSETWDPVAERLAHDHRVIRLDLRGHGASGAAADYGVESLASDAVAVMTAAAAESPRLVGHSLGGVVVSAVGAALDVESVVCVDQSLQLGGFRDQLLAVEGMLRDPEAFPLVMGGLFEELSGSLLGDEERARIAACRRPDQAVVLGIWDLILTAPVEDLEAAVDAIAAGYAGRSVPYLALFGADPGPDYESWLRGHIAGATMELWPEHGHYPHLVDPDRFVARLRAFWGES